MFVLPSELPCLICLSNTPVCCTRHLEVQGCSLMKVSAALDQVQPVDVLWLYPQKEFAVRADMSHRMQNRGPTQDFSVISMSLSWPEDRWNSPRRSWERGRLARSLNLLPHWPSQKEFEKKWPTGQMLSALLMESEIRPAAAVTPKRENFNGFFSREKVKKKSAFVMKLFV